ncbi:hypothetical protein MXD63_40955, partial [Frankia sp. Cpl3]|nr:hypothetical protein [Frankia sp. Cpl3]
MPTYLKWRESTWGEFLDGFIQHPPLRQQLSMLTGYVGDMGEATPSSSMLPIMGYFIVGGFRPAGGSGNLAAVLVKKLREYGGEAVLREEVVSLLLEQNQVKGVQTKKHTYYAPVVISNVDPRVT